MVAAASAQAAAITGDEAQDPVLRAYQRNQTVRPASRRTSSKAPGISPCGRSNLQLSGPPSRLA
jgi:hypothetical protein